MTSVAVVGGGFGGVGALVMLARAGYRDVTVFERGDRIGGVWNHNTYPGAACDVPSHLYEFSFAPNPRWSRRYSPQAEIQAYMEDVVRRHGAEDRIRTGTEVKQARWMADRSRWSLQTTAGEHEADVLITACGQLSVPSIPPLAGLESFAGPVFHTAEWRHDVGLEGRRVAVMGTGCSAIQVVPAIQPIVSQLDVYQRSPGWTFPRMDFPYSERAKRQFERYPSLQRLDRASIFAFHEAGAAAMTSKPWLLPAFRAVGRLQINRAIKDPGAAPQGHPDRRDRLQAGDADRRLVPDADQGQRRAGHRSGSAITPAGVRAGGPERPADVLVLATGFRTHGFVAPMEVIGREGRTLAEVWDGIPRAYLGVSVPAFPNLFLIYGPNTNGGTGSVIYTIESSIAHAITAIGQLDRVGRGRIEVRADVAERFDRELRAALAGTVWHTGCTNWYVDENGNDPNQWPWLWHQYRRRAATIEPGTYEIAAA